MGPAYRAASVKDKLSYVGFKNLLIGRALFLGLKGAGSAGVVTCALTTPPVRKLLCRLSCVITCVLRWRAGGDAVGPSRASRSRPPSIAPPPGDVVEIQLGHYHATADRQAVTLRGLKRPTISGGMQGDTIPASPPRRHDRGPDRSATPATAAGAERGIYLRPGIAPRRRSPRDSSTTCSDCGSRRPTMYASRTT